MRNYDLDFLKKFSLVILFLIVVTGGLIGLAWWLHGTIPAQEPESVTRQRLERIAPVADVYAGSTGAAAQAAASVAAAAQAASQVAYGGTLDGAVIYKNLCAGCHTSGAGGAPTLVRAQWTARLGQGTDTLHRHAIEGFTGAAGVMPARGGNPALSDEQVVASVDWMIENLQ
ncbi:cytochrome c5 family protein [Luteimonas yindakuii]|uniref:Cytochrome c5 family protein n=1 Tax=Luteimonas yindakuii TaxID=2565782 RepID=A0A4Z1R662_9GAMM|nr:c-type cytochrome [Luteimonas yindakuii]QCO66604.1 cytochrome c5 family protein [Luteimonas yindakuii]TKS55132.1 cytochrome c5 family protein [Luteimonas yindakuii]